MYRLSVRTVQCITLPVLLSLSLTAHGEIHFVSPSGDDQGAGSATDPWLTLQHAANSVMSGDSVLVSPGTYTGFDLSTSGQSGSPITFRAEPGVLINTPNSRTPDGINLEGASYILIDGFEVNGMPRAGIRSVVNDHVTIRNNRVDLSGRWGIFSGFSDDLLIENNEASRSQAEHGIYVSNSGDRPTIRDNIIWGNASNGIHMNGDLSQGGDGIISDALVERNIIYGNGVTGGSGINADGIQDSIFRNNLLYDNHSSGISLYSIDGAEGSKNNVVANNTIVQAPDGRWALNIQDGSTGNSVVNNILYNHHSFRGSIDISANSLPGFFSDSNIVMERFTTDGGNSVLDLNQWRLQTGQDINSAVATPNELFVAANSDDYHLLSASPATDAGTFIFAPSGDLENRFRPLGTGIDIGALETVPLVDFCDFDGNLACDTADINLMYAQGDLVNGVLVSPGSSFDLNQDLKLDNQDLDRWLASAAATNGFLTPYRRGDTDGIGVTAIRDVDITDFQKLLIHFDPIGSNGLGNVWEYANFDGDNDVDITDFNHMLDNFAPTSYGGQTAVSVPESASIVLSVLAFAISAMYVRWSA